jgi:pyruvate-formate lyase-activating enzyme
MLMIQTTSACNSSCVFCPHSRFQKQLPQGEMSDALFEEIIVEAGHHPEVTCINLFLMNEPLMDRRIVQRIHLSKQHNPQAQISLWSNGVALTPPLIHQLLTSPLDSLGVSIHAHRPETYRRITGRSDFDRVLHNVVHLAEQRQIHCPQMSLSLRYVATSAPMDAEEERELIAFWEGSGVVLDIDEGYLSRAGLIQAPAYVSSPHRWLRGCNALGGPKQAHILFSGQVVLCCMDYRRTTRLGDRTTEDLHQIWTGPRRRFLVETLYGKRPAEPTLLCSRCELALTP